LKKFLAKNSILRSLFIPLLKTLNFPFKWKHDITGRDFYLQTFSHKGYWYYGRKREEGELSYFYKFIKKGDSVLEVGSHIGYLTQVFESLVSDDGKVIVLEPTPQSLFYLKKNVLPKTKIVEKAASNFCGDVEFYTEEFGGFMNSLISEFTQSQNESQQKSRYFSSSVNSIKVQADTLDNICKEIGFEPDFIKIDVEGAELDVLKGAKTTLANVNALMVEVSRNNNEVFNFLSESGFKRINSLHTSDNHFFVRELHSQSRSSSMMVH